MTRKIVKAIVHAEPPPKTKPHVYEVGSFHQIKGSPTGSIWTTSRGSDDVVVTTKKKGAHK